MASLEPSDPVKLPPTNPTAPPMDFLPGQMPVPEEEKYPGATSLLPQVLPFPDPIPLPTLSFVLVTFPDVFKVLIILFFQLFQKFFYFLLLIYVWVNFVLIKLSW